MSHYATTNTHGCLANNIRACSYIHTFQARLHTSEKRLLASSCLSACINSTHIGWIFVEFHIADLHPNPYRKSKFLYDQTKISGILH